MKKLPIDISSFKKMINEDYIYVDKTEHIYNLVTQGRFYFLSRPRRFGKSLLISTLKELFLGNKELFKHLWIAKSDYQWLPHSVIHLNFSELDLNTSQEFTLSLAWKLNEIADAYGIDVAKAPSAGTKLQKLVTELAKKQSVVILIDEYDYPLLNNLDYMTIAKAHQKVIKNFFSVIKSLDEFLHFIFITGVTKFSKTSIFSGMNNLNDISTDTEGATLLGYTHQELITVFKSYLETIVQQEQRTHESLAHQLQDWYDGYCFSEDLIKVYNPFSVLYFLSKKKLRNYWFESGTPSFLVQLLKNEYQAIEHIENIELSNAGLGTIELEHIPLIPLLFQTGYLTIKHYDASTQKYTLSYPNTEVRDSFKTYLVAALLQSTTQTVETALSQLAHALKTNDIALFCTILQTMFAHIPYYLHIEKERYYHALFQFMGSLLSFDIQSEVTTDKGRIDVVLITKMYIYIFEIKFNVSAKKALAQIEERKYYERYLLHKKTIILVGLAFKRSAKKFSIDYAIKNL